MPTPFMHLQIAEQIGAAPELSDFARHLLHAAWPAFYFGNVAPDFQAICGLPRETTHFYGSMPLEGKEAYAIMLAHHPQLVYTPQMPLAQAAFIAGYCVHLLFDLCWYRQILLPFFANPPYWQDNWQRFLAHNALLIFLDRVALNSLSVDASHDLAGAMPDSWLPFAADAELIKWRDNLTSQLSPGASVQTIEIYAQRMKMVPAEFAANLQDPDWMAQIVFDKVPLAAVQEILDACRQRALSLITQYLAVPAVFPLI